MSTMYRLRIPWSGSAVVGGGLTTLYFGALATPSAITPAVNTFLTALRTYVPTGNTWNIPNGGDVIDVPTGALVGSWTGGGAYTVTGNDFSNYAAGVGGRINWQTTGIANGRRVKGAMYLAPMGDDCFASDGSLNNGYLTTINAACAAFIATANVDLCVWHRPHPKGASNGDIFAVTTGTMADKISWLRTRRT